MLVENKAYRREKLVSGKLYVMDLENNLWDATE